MPSLIRDSYSRFPNDSPARLLNPLVWIYVCRIFNYWEPCLVCTLVGQGGRTRLCGTEDLPPNI